ncbi:hypothetical protein [Methylocystis suflitae]|uniref:hypothetical protein n=1 Tax=Methylocystis suflitae TaxID=2951405 RepID=UPI00210C0189|nr:hypothetical protein [Methylocystis suflitae]MCQ4188850.1 hypothetical protein [Methylocystis suflitae]
METLRTTDANTQAADLRARLREALKFEAGFGDECHEIVEKVFALVAQALRRDPRFSALRHSELDALLRDALAPAERLVRRYLADTISVDDAVDHAMDVFCGEEAKQ